MVNLSSSVLMISNLTFILINIATICWGDVRLLDSSNKYAKEYIEKFDEFLTDAVPSIRKVKLKFFLDSEPVLKMTYELNC